MKEEKKTINIALIAHDGKKADMVSFVMRNIDILKQEHIKIHSTGTTGEKIEKSTQIDVIKHNSGPLGGDVTIASEVINNNMKMVLFFRDPLGKHVHEPDILMLSRQCDVHNIPIATNEATAEILIKELIKKIDNDIEKYLPKTIE